MSYESVNKIKSLQQGIETFTGKSYGDLTAAVQELKNGYGSSGGGSGIIEVPELPTENIDENAVYKVTENIQVEKTEIYIVQGGNAITVQQYLISLGVPTVPNIYVVDELPSDMKATDIQTFSELHYYIVKSDGIVYAYVPAYGGVITGGLFVFQVAGYDKGFTENIYNETEVGVYTTLEAYEQVEKWFIRDNGEWKRISPDTQTKEVTFTESGTYDILPDDDKVFSSVTVNVAVDSVSGIIEVPELPTSGIDENAVYKVIKNTEPIAYVYNNGGYDTLENVLKSKGISEVHFYFVEKLPSDMLTTDMNNLSTSPMHCYINSSGAAYVKAANGYTWGLSMIYGFTNKGYTDDITTVSANGMYVQKAITIEKWFVRDNGEWRMISPDTQEKTFSITSAGKKTISPDEGKVLSTVTVSTDFLTIGNLIDDLGEIEITEECFLKSDGTYVTTVRAYAFAGSKIISAIIPDAVIALYNAIFTYSSVQEVTFKGTPRHIENSAFSNTGQLTTINVPWSEGEVSGAPWGATNATINYNYTGE